jgi:DNA-binding transcriptional MerR regulator
MATARKKNKKPDLPPGKRQRRHSSAAPDVVVVPDKLYFRIGEVSRLCRLPSYVLRFWETEFPQLKPAKSGSGQRMYRRRDVELVLQIKKLLYEEGYTIAGAREKLKSDMRSGKLQAGLPFPALPRTDQLKAVRQELQELASMLAPKRRK